MGEIFFPYGIVFACWHYQRTQWEYEACTCNWFWLHNIFPWRKQILPTENITIFWGHWIFNWWNAFIEIGCILAVHWKNEARWMMIPVCLSLQNDFCDILYYFKKFCWKVRVTWQLSALWRAHKIHWIEILKSWLNLLVAQTLQNRLHSLSWSTVVVLFRVQHFRLFQTIERKFSCIRNCPNSDNAI